MRQNQEARIRSHRLQISIELFEFVSDRSPPRLLELEQRTQYEMVLCDLLSQNRIVEQDRGVVTRCDEEGSSTRPEGVGNL